MKEIGDRTGLPLVLHGGTGIPTKDIQKSVSLGTAKINVNTENQIASAKAVREVLAAQPEQYDPRKYLHLLAKQSKKRFKVKCVNSVLLTKHNLKSSDCLFAVS